ncbi:MAG: MATE family efflux transporter [Solobacterium sp.]|nr:MATE family efflux transporter [Solobacterium sp.]
MKETDRTILRILIPVILENALMTLSSMILTGYIGRLTVDQISIYGLQNRIYGIYYMLFKGVAIGVLVLIAGAFGRRDHNEAERLLKNSYMCVIPAAVILLGIIAVFRGSILSVMTNDAALLDGTKAFLNKTMWFFPMLAVISLNASAFQANGNTRTPMFIAALGNLVSIVCGYVLIFGIGSFGGFGLDGAAYAQRISFTAMMLCGLWFLYGRHGLFAGMLTRIPRPDLNTFRDICRLGIPASLESSAWQISTIFISRVILLYGKDTYAAYQFGLQAEGFCDMMTAGFTTAALTLSANAIGALDEGQYRLGFRRLFRFGVIISAITSLYLLLFSRFTLTLLTDKEHLISIALVYMYLMIFSQFPQHVQKIYAGYIRTSGHPKTPMLINMTGLWGVRLPLTIIAGQLLHLPVFWLWVIIDIDQWVRFTLSYILMKKDSVMQYVAKLKNA